MIGYRNQNTIIIIDLFESDTQNYNNNVATCSVWLIWVLSFPARTLIMLKKKETVVVIMKWSALALDDPVCNVNGWSNQVFHQSNSTATQQGRNWMAIILSHLVQLYISIVYFMILYMMTWILAPCDTVHWWTAPHHSLWGCFAVYPNLVLNVIICSFC